MKFTYIPMLLAGILIPTHASTPSLQDQWYLEDPGFNYTSSSDVKTFDLTYRFSELINDDKKTRATLWFYKDTNFDGDENCYNPTVDNTYSGPGLTLLPSEPEDSNANSYKVNRKEKVQVQLNTDVIDTDTDVFSQAGGTASVKFCVRFSLCTVDCEDLTGSSYEVNFLESLVELTVDLRGEFTVDDISVAPKDKLKRTANQEYGLTAFQCTGKNPATTAGIKNESPPTFNQGDVIKICVEPDDTAQGDNIFMKEVETFTYYLMEENDPTTATSTFQEAIKNSQTMFGLTEIDACRGHVACLIKTILFATFYTRSGTVSGSGTATMQFGTATNRRDLRGVERQLQAGDDVAGAGEFDVNFQIESNDTFQSASGASSSMSILALVGSAAAALML